MLCAKEYYNVGMQMPTAIIIDRDDGIRSLLADLLSGEGWSVVATVADPELLRSVAVDLVVVELSAWSPNHTLQLLERFRAEPDNRHVSIIVTSTDHKLLYNCAPQLHRYDCRLLVKPFEFDLLLNSLYKAREIGG